MLPFQEALISLQRERDLLIFLNFWVQSTVWIRLFLLLEIPTQNHSPHFIYKHDVLMNLFFFLFQ